MADTKIHWVPASAAALTSKRQRVRTTTDAKVAAESVVLGAAAVVMPVGGVLGLLCLVGFLVTLRGLYLSSAGVTVWRGVLPQSVIPWAEVAGFRLGRD